VHDFDAAENDGRAAEVLEGLYRACDVRVHAMVLLDNVVEALADIAKAYDSISRP
jgi:hypothetical protein